MDQEDKEGYQHIINVLNFINHKLPLKKNEAEHGSKSLKLHIDRTPGGYDRICSFHFGQCRKSLKYIFFILADTETDTKIYF